DGLNRFYVRAEEEHLAARFRLPPGAFDNIEESGLNAGRSAELLDKLSRSEADNAARLEVIQKLDADNAARLEVIQKLDGRLKAAELELHDLDRPWKALMHLGYRIRVSIAALRSNPYRRK